MEFTHDLQHFGRVVAGLESVHEHICYNAGIDVDGTYALTVLKLHAEDAGEVEGTEGFLATVKQGAKDLVKWIKQIIETIARFIVGRPKAPKYQDRWKEINDEEVAAALRRIYEGPLKAIINHINDDAVESIRDHVKFLDLDAINEQAQKALNYLDSEALSSYDMFMKMNSISMSIRKELESVKKALNSVDTNKPGAGKVVRELASLAEALGKADEVITAAWMKQADVLAEATLKTLRRDTEEKEAAAANKDKK